MTLRFGTDGVRGVANVELTVELVTALGRAACLGRDRQRPAVQSVVGRDTRRSGPMLEAALIDRGDLCAEGADVTPGGRAPHAGRRAPWRVELRLRHAAVISASHNPPFGDNGIKLFAPGGRKIPESRECRSARVEQELQARSRRETSPSSGPEGIGVGVSSEHRTALDDYVATLVDSLQGRTARRIVRRGARLRQWRRVPRRAHRLARARRDGRRDPRVARRRQHQRRLPGPRTRRSCRKRCWCPAPTPASPSTATPTA